MNEINTQYVGVSAPALAHVPATSLVAGVITADRRRQVWGGVCPLAASFQVQGSTVPTATSITTGVMGITRFDFDKYRTGSPAPGLSG